MGDKFKHRQQRFPKQKKGDFDPFRPNNGKGKRNRPPKNERNDGFNYRTPERWEDTF